MYWYFCSTETFCAFLSYRDLWFAWFLIEPAMQIVLIFLWYSILNAQCSCIMARAFQTISYEPLLSSLV
jgi:hypothetical protein